MSKKADFRDELFVKEWCIDRNGTRAAIACGISESWAHVFASKHLKNPKIQRLIDKELSRRATKLELTAEKLDEETARLAFANMGDYVRVDEDGKPSGINLENITRDQWAAVHEIREDTTGGTGDGERKQILRTTLKLTDKTKNLELLYRRLGLLQDNLKVSGLEGLADKLNRIRTNKAK